MKSNKARLIPLPFHIPRPLMSMAKPNVVLTVSSVLLALVIAPVLFLHHYQTTYGYDLEVIYFGWLLVACFVVASFTVLLFLTALLTSPRDKFWSAVFTGFFTFANVAIGLIYLSAYISNRVWGDTVTYDIAAIFARDSGALADLLPFSAEIRTILVSLALFGLTVLVFIAFLLSRFSAIQLLLRVTNWLRQAPSSREGRRRALVIFGSLGMTTLTFATLLFVLIERAPARLVGEPISSFLKWFSASDTLRMDSFRLQAALEDRIARANYPKAVSFSKKNVVLLFADSLRADRMGVYDYMRDTTPFLSSVYRQGLLHRTEMALSTCSESYCGIASTLASRPFHQVSEKSLKLHSLLMELGYRNSFFISGDHRAWKYVYNFYGQDIHLFYDYLADGRYSLDDDRKILDGLQRVGPFLGTPNFFYFFLMSSHVTGTRLPEYERFAPSKFDNFESLWNEVGGTQRIGGKVSRRNTFDPRESTIFANHYDNGVLQADAMIAKIFGILADKGYLKDGIVVILGDHGDGLGEHGHLGHTRYLYQEDIRIPLLIYDRDISVYRNRRFATQIDVAPTIIDRLGLPLPASWQGKSLLRPPEERVTLHQTRRGANLCRAAVSSGGASLYKYIRCGAGGARQTEELYDLNTDPHERANLLRKGQPPFVGRLREEIDSRFAITTNLCKSQECVD